MRIKNLIYILLVLTLVAACGRRSLPKPPEERAPAAVREARLEPKEQSLEIFWKAPLETASGDDLFYLKSFDILRRVIKKDRPDSYLEIAVIDVPEEEISESAKSDKKGFGKKKTSDREFHYADSDIELGNMYEYLIVPRSSEGIEGVPNISFRVSFLGLGSVVETIPFSIEEPEDKEGEDK